MIDHHERCRVVVRAVSGTGQQARHPVPVVGTNGPGLPVDDAMNRIFDRTVRTSMTQSSDGNPAWHAGNQEMKILHH